MVVYVWFTGNKVQTSKGETQVQTRQYYEGSAKWIKGKTPACKLLVQ